MGAEIERTPEGFRLIGDLDFVSVPGLYRRIEELLDRPCVRLDLDGVRQANSAGVGLLLEWRREAQRRGVILELVHVPDAVLRVARMCGAEALLIGSVPGRRA
jgi:phospholipid transport system transporter-binding protein